MPVFFLCFIVFIIWIRVKSKQQRNNTSTWDEAYWEKERSSNFSRKKSIVDLDYLQVTEDDLPFSDFAKDDEKYRQENVRELLTKKMLNLSGLSNADIKLKYGTANFPVLSVYDQNYTLFIRNLNLWGKELYKNSEIRKDNLKRARQVFEYAISIGSDISETYITLAKIYIEQEEIDKIQGLIDHVENSDFYRKDTIIQQLKNCIQTF